MKWGNIELDIIDDGLFRLDGGAMFGVVPKVLWNRIHPADEKNRIQLRAAGLLIRTPEENILVDTGIGTKLNARDVGIYGYTGPRLLESLKKTGLSPEDIDKVVYTHLHFDHCGGGTRLNGRRGSVPVFENAQYIIQKRDMEEASHTNARTKSSYSDEDILPLQDAGQVMIIEGNTEICPDVWTEHTGGHTGGHQIVYIESGNKDGTAVFLGDLIPTVAHLKVPYIMAYDLYPVDVIETKERFLQEALEKQWLLIFQHDPHVQTGYLQKSEGKYTLKKA